MSLKEKLMSNSFYYKELIEANWNSIYHKERQCCRLE